MAEDTEEAVPDPTASGDHDGRLPDPQRLVDGSDYLIHGIEAIGALVFALLFAIGLFDLVVLIWDAIQAGNISDPEQVVAFVDRGLLLFIIAEVYQTVVAYVRQQAPRIILRLVIFTGIIAIVRKVIVYRTDVFATKTDALIVAGAYAVLLLGLAVLMIVEQRGGIVYGTSD